MNKSKILIGAGALLIAIAGAFTSMANYSAANYFYKPTASTCAPISTSFNCVTGGTGCTQVVSGIARQLYQDAGCTQSLKQP